MKALVVEDSKTQAAWMKGALERAGMQVVLAHDGNQGLELCRKLRPDVVVSDVMMPGLSGYELCRSIKADPEIQDIPVLLLTALTDPSNVLRAVEAGADNYLAKPCPDRKLVERVRRCVDPTSSAASEAVRRTARAPAEVGPRLIEILASALEDAAERNVELEASREKLARANTQSQDLMAAVAHELKTPLQALSMKAELALMKPEDLELKNQLAQAIRTQVKTMVRIINDLLDMTSIEAGSVRIDPVELNFGELVAELTERLRLSYSTHQIELHNVTEVTVRADPARIEQVISNFITNAVKYSADGSIITLKVEALQAKVRVSVIDRGIGIDSADVPQLFGRYFRARSGRRAAAGAGLGLYVSKQLVQLHGGTVGVDSQVGVGSTFWFELPQA
ncbi:MAG TPA: hybrid sensor histidine kinase/response regulator [Polyangiaceae bacterium]|nr:hybrid sensor histidine kinase/response regulator [Polyangiaceae bacterium]